MAKQRPESEACAVERRIYYPEVQQRKLSAGGGCRTMKGETVPWFNWLTSLWSADLGSRTNYQDLGVVRQDQGDC